MVRRVVAVAMTALVVSGCSPAGGPSAAERTTTTTIAATPTTTTPPISGERQLCDALAATDLSNPQELAKVPLSRTTDSAFDVPFAFLAARLAALKSAIQTGPDLTAPTQDAANAATDVLDVCRQRGYL